MTDIKQKTVSGFAYKFAERVGAQGISFITQIVLARLLMPSAYGTIALVVVFISLCDVFVTYGFGNSLIVNKKSDSKDFSTCFFFGLFLAIIFYLIIFFSAGWIADFYNNDELVLLIRVMGIRIPVAAVNSVQHAYVSKNMWFKKFFYATLIGTVISGVIAIGMAYLGWGIWALVEQYLGNVVLDTICLWIIVGWRPTKEFSFERLKAIYSYGWKILVVGLIDTFYGQLRNLIIGKKYSSEDLAYYNRGYNFPSVCMGFIEPTINTVLFPALAQCQDSRSQMKDITRKVIMVSTFIISPMMIGLVVVAKPLVIVLLTEKWLNCVIYLQIGCVANIFRPGQLINNCIIRAAGNSALLLKLDVLKKIIGLIILLFAMNYGVNAIAMSLIVFYFISLIINIAPNRKILDYGYKMQFNDYIKNLIPAIIMGVIIYPVSFLKLHQFAILLLQALFGVVIYIGLAIIFKNESFAIIFRLLKKHKQKC